MSNERQAKLFRNGRSQAVRIPREFELPGDTVTVRRVGGQLILEPITKPSLLEWLATLEPIADDFDFGEDRPPEPFEL